MTTVQNDTGSVQQIEGLIFQAGESRDISLELSPSEIFDAWVTPLGKSLADALDAADFSLQGVALPPGMTPGMVVTAATQQTVQEDIAAETIPEAPQDGLIYGRQDGAWVPAGGPGGGAYYFRGEVANQAALATFAAPQDEEYAAVQATGTLWQYDGAAWTDTGINASFQDWIPPVGPSPLPINEGAITPDLSYSFDVAFQGATGAVYRISNTASGYNQAGFASVNVVSQAGDYFEFPSVVINNIQGFGLASTDTLNGTGPNQNGVGTPGVFCTPPSNMYAYTGRDVMGYFKSNGLYTTGAQNGGALNMYQPTEAERNESGVWSTGGKVRVGLDAQYRFYVAMWLPGAQVWKTLFQSTTPLPVQSYRFAWVGNYANSVLSQLPNQVVTPPPAGGYSDLFYVQLDGFNEYVEVGSPATLAQVLDYGQPWAFGCKIANTWNPLGAYPVKYTLLKNGNNTIYVNPQPSPGGNSQPYITGGSASVGANTWTALPPGTRLLFQSNGANIQFFVNGTQKWSTTISAAVVAGNSPDGVFTIGQGGPVTNYLQGGIDNCWFMGRPLIGAEIAEAGAGGDPQGWTFYAELLAYLLMGEGGPSAYPDITDLTGNIPDAVLINGEDTDFAAY